MTDEQILRIAAKHDIDEYLPEALTIEFARAVLAAGASEGQAEPIYQVKRVHGWVDVPESRYTEIKEDPNDCGELRILYLHPSAELAALRERIAILEHERDEAIAAEEKVQELHDALFERFAGMEKDAERYRWIKENAEVIFKESRGFISSASGRLIFSSMPAVQELDAAIDGIIKEEAQEAAAKEPK